jgi:predicted transcriptional regulator
VSPVVANFTQDQVAYEILMYLAESPTAQDTLQGIMEWWLLEQHIKRQTSVVKSALAQLVAEGLVLERKRRDGRIHYRVNRQKRTELKALLKHRPE